MQPEIRKERVMKYGSFLYCPIKDTLCCGRDTEDGACGYDTCILDDPSYIEKQKKIEENRRRNEAKNEASREEEKNIYIRRQTKTKEDLIREELVKLENKAAYLYRKNKPKAADSVMHDVVKLRNKLIRMRGKTYDK